MDSFVSTSSPSCMPAFDVHSNHRDGQDWLSGWINGEAKPSNPPLPPHAAGSVGSSPFPSPSPPTQAIYSFDNWAALLSSNCFSGVHASREFGVPNSDPSSICGSQDSELSSSCTSTPLSSVPSPLGNDISPYFTSPDHLLHLPSSPFSLSNGVGQELVAPLQPHQHPTAPWPQLADIPYSTSCGQPLPTLIPLPGAADVPGQGTQSIETSNIGAPPGNFTSTSTLMETTALGLYYADTPQSSDVSLLPQGDASVPPVADCSPPTPTIMKWTFRAVDPSPKAQESKRARSDKTQAVRAAIAATTSTSHGAEAEPMIKCKTCGYVQLKRRMGDFRRHLKKHEAEHLSRVICCGVPPSHPAAASLRPGHLAHLYGDQPFYGGCGRSYSRMDALQRHLKKSDCVGGSTRDHVSWRKLYFSDETRYTR